MAVGFSPSARGFKPVNINEVDQDFTFIVSSGRHYHCPHFLAEFISPRVFNIRQADSIINEISFSVDDNCFSSLLKSIERGESHSISQEDRSTYLDLFCQLQNAELCEFMKQALNIETVFDLIKLNCVLESNSSTELDFLASKFPEFDDPFED
jgi:hypothetical protein